MMHGDGNALFRSFPRLLQSPLTLLTIALLQGLLYLFLFPPWQHYDEPGHFEYAWLLAHHGRLTEPEPAVGELRQQVVASMQAHDFFWNLPEPQPGWWFNVTQLYDPPAYYALVSLPLHLVQEQDITTQLYVARSVSLLLFLLTIGVSIGMLRDITPPGHPLRWAVPLNIILLPPFADIMTAVNNNVGAIFAASLFLWGAVRTISAGITWRRIAWVIAAALFATAVKNVNVFTLALAPIVLIVALWNQQGWRWRWLFTIAGSMAVIGIAVTLEWGDAACWYRWIGAEQQSSDTRAYDPQAPHDPHTIMLTADPQIRERRLINPLLDTHIQQIAGRTITIGGWLWADQTARVPAPGIAQTLRAGEAYNTTTHLVDVTTTPTFVAWHYDVPPATAALHYVFSIAPPRVADEQRYLFLDGAVLAAGTFPLDEPPRFTDSTAQQGTWSGQPFTNLVRNAHGEQTWPRLRPWVATTVGTFLDTGWGRTPSLLLAAFWDMERSSHLLLHYTGFTPLDSLTTRLAWGHIQLNTIWKYLFRAVVLVALIGTFRWFIRPPAASKKGLRPALLVAGLAALLVWGITITRVLPRISEGVVFPFAHYTFPAILPTALAIVGGWWACWPARFRRYALAVLTSGTVALNGAAIWTIWSFYQSLP
jgi:hypothetical protein